MDAMLPTSWTVRERRADTADTFTLELTPADGNTRLEFRPGQFNMIYVFGVGEVPISISGSSGRGAVVQHTTRDVGVVTGAMAKLERGDAVGIRGPFGQPWPIDEADGQDVLFIAGGIGLAPLKPAIEEVIEQRARYGRVLVLYGARTPADLLFRADLDRWQTRHDVQVITTVDRTERAWHGRVGVIPAVIKRAHFDASNAIAMICGPEIMMRFCAAELIDRGLPESRIHVSLERNMKCAIGFCGHCQFGPAFVCKDGPVFRWDRVRELVAIPEI